MDTETDHTPPNRRQRIDAAEAALDRAATDQVQAEKRKMRAMQEMVDSDVRVTETAKAVDRAREALMEALAYVDAPAPAAPFQAALVEEKTEVRENGVVHTSTFEVHA